MFEKNNTKNQEPSFYLFKNNYHSGPFEKERIREMLIKGFVNGNDIVCAEGEEEWIAINQLLKIEQNNQGVTTQHAISISGDTFYIIVENESKGPYTLNQIRSMWNSGSVTVQTMFMTENSTDWIPLKTILHKLEPSTHIQQNTENLPPILHSPVRKVQTIEATSKTWKGLLVLSVLLIIAGFFTLFGSISSGCGMIFSGFLLFVFARVGSWWSHG